MINMACVMFRLTPAEALAGVTIKAAQALGLSDDVGNLEIGKKADLVVWDITEPGELAYRFGGNPCRTVVKEGEIVFRCQQL
jgi:imidazolonepropionase